MTVATCLLALCSILLALVVGYAWWTQVRVIGLKADLLSILADLRAQIVRLDGENDPGFVETEKAIRTYLDVADSLSVPIIYYLIFSATQNSSGERVLSNSDQTPATNLRLYTAQDPHLQRPLDEATARVIARVGRYLGYETLTGWAVRLLTWPWPRSVAKEQTKESVARAIEPLNVTTAIIGRQFKKQSTAGHSA